MLRLVVASDAQQRADAERVRARVYCEEERMFQARATRASREPVLATAVDLVVYAESEAVGALRLNVAQTGPHATNHCAGLELASKFVFRGFEQPSVVLGEVTGFCVLRRFRGTRVAGALFSALRVESERRGVTHWIATANTETDSAEDADIIYGVLRAQGLVNDAFQADPLGGRRSRRRATRFVYTRAERLLARKGQLGALKLPRVLALFAKRMGARYIGYPAYDHDFNVFAAPLAVDLSTLPQRSPALPELP